MKKVINITAINAERIAAIEAAGKQPWVIVHGEYLVGVYSGRTEARARKAEEGYQGTISKAEEFQFVEVTSPAEKKKSAEKVTPIGAEVEGTANEVLHESSIDHPCKTVWMIADQLKIEQPTAKRAVILATCVAAGIAYYTARTQYQQWRGVQKEMAEREAAQAAGIAPKTARAA